MLVVGGEGSLYTNAEHTQCVMDLPDFPESYKPLAFNMKKALDALRLRQDVRWTYLSPAADYAMAMLDEVESRKHLNTRFTVVSK